MKAIISSTNDPLYNFFIPIVTYCWNKLGVDVIVFVPSRPNKSLWFAMEQINKDGSNRNSSYGFVCQENKTATYAQCSRLYASSLSLPEDEILITSDVDMIVFKIPPNDPEYFTVFGSDLVPKKQIPMCYVSATKKLWNTFFSKDRTYQDCLDILLGGIEAEHFRGNYWAKDQEELYNGIAYYAPLSEYPRAKPGTQFATNRLDRDDSYLLDRLSSDIFDYHMPRPGYEDKAFEQILIVLKYFYPNDDLQWLIDYRNEYIKLL